MTALRNQLKEENNVREIEGKCSKEGERLREREKVSEKQRNQVIYKERERTMKLVTLGVAKREFREMRDK